MNDVDGEEPISNMVASITKDKEGVVTCLYEAHHGYEDGDHITFTEIQGMTELNGCKPIKIKVLGPYTFSIGDTTKFSNYEQGGVVSQVKTHKTIHFKSIKAAMNANEFLMTDFAKFDRPDQLHIGFQALYEFQKQKGQLPRSRCKADADEFLKVVKALNEKSPAKADELDENVMREMAYTCRGERECNERDGLPLPWRLVSTGSHYGRGGSSGGHEACFGKFHPVCQYIYFDALECLPEDKDTSLTEENCQPTNSRYDGQVAIFGSDFQEKMGNLKYFLVGAGAIGCEMLKNWALMGLSAGENGHI
eukprot:XP_019919911.1 PREDICTED: ubiquitin-like modifier-activating enzyme 1 [Crassostrea gigas]